MAPKLLPAAKIGIKKKTISADSIRPNSPKEEKPLAIGASEKSSNREILLSIKDFITAKFKRGISSFTMKRREKQKEKIEAREKKIENKEGKLKLGNLIKPPKFVGNIFSSITNLLLFVAGGILFNILGLEKSLIAIEKSLEIIGKGVEIFANIVGGFTNFIDSAVKGYDDFLQKIEDITGFDKTKVEKFMDDFKYVINGAIIAAILTVRALPGLFRKCLPKPPKPPKTPKIPKSRMAGGSNTGIDYRRGYTPSGQTLRSGPSISRFNNSMAKFLKGTADPGDIARLTRRGFFQQFKNIKLPSIKSFRPSAAAVSSTATGLLKGGATLGISILADMAVDSTFSVINKKISREQVKNLVKKFGVEDSLNKIRERLKQEYDKPVAPWWMLGLMDKEGMGTGRYRDQKFINNEAYKLKYLTEKSLELSQAMVGDKSTQNIASLMDYADYEVELTQITNNIIQPIQV